MDVKENLPKFLRKNLEETVGSLVNNHELLKSNPFAVSADKIVENIMKSKEVNEITHKLANDINQTSFDLSIDSNLEMDDFISTNILTLIIDKKAWSIESKLLREQLLSKDNDLFQSSYRTHFRLINNPDTVNEGTLNIVRTLKVYFLNMTKQFNTMGLRINLKINTQKNLLKLVNMLLQALTRLHKYHKHQNIESTIVQLMELITLPAISKKIDKLHFLNYAAIIDPKALWFKKITSFSFYRNIIITFLKENPTLMEYFFTEIFTNMHCTNLCLLRYIQVQHKSELGVQLIKLVTFYSFCYMIGQLLQFSDGSIFTDNIQLNDEPVNIFKFVKYLIESANIFAIDRLQYGKYKVIVDVLKQIIISNCYVLNDTEIAQNLILPLKVNDKSKGLLSITKKFLYIFETCSAISKMEQGIYILYGFNNNDGKITSRKKSSSSINDKYASTQLDRRIKHYLNSNKDTSIADTLVQFTTLVLKYFIANYKMHDMEFPYIILKHIIDILECERHILYWYKIDKFVTHIKDLYRIALKQNSGTTSANLSKVVLSEYVENVFYTFCTVSVTFHVLCNEKQLLHTFGSRFFFMEKNFWERKYFSTFLLNLCGCQYGSEIFLENKEYIVTPFLINIWRLLEDEMILLTGSDRVMSENIFRFLKMITMAAMNLKCCQIMFKENLLDDVTVTDQDNYPKNLTELVEYGLTSNGLGNSIEFTSLNAIKLLIMNMDIYLFLENKFKLEENLTKIQNDCLINDSKDAYIIDECSSIRHEILTHIKDIGFPKCESVYVVKSSSLTFRKQNNELQRFLKETKNNLHDNSWMLQVRRAHRLSLDENIKEHLVYEVVTHLKKFNQNSRNKFEWPKNESNLTQLKPEEIIGVSVIIKYGFKTKILTARVQNEELLTLFIKQVNSFLNRNSEEFEGFDWFAGIVFLICSGNLEKCKTMLTILTDLPIGPYIWPTLRTQEFQTSWTKFESNMQILLHEMEMDKIFEVSQISVSGFIDYIFNNCFLNILDWHEICHFLIMIVTNPPEYLIYYTIGMLENIKDDLVNLCVNNDINDYDKILRCEGFKLKNALPIMEKMAKQYKCLNNDRK